MFSKTKCLAAFFFWRKIYVFLFFFCGRGICFTLKWRLCFFKTKSPPFFFIGIRFSGFLWGGGLFWNKSNSFPLFQRELFSPKNTVSEKKSTRPKETNLKKKRKKLFCKKLSGKQNFVFPKKIFFSKKHRRLNCLFFEKNSFGFTNKSMVELTGTPHTHVCEDNDSHTQTFGERREWEKNLTSEASTRRQTFGERDEFWEKTFDEPSEPLAVFFFQTVGFPPQKCQKSPQTGGGWGGGWWKKFSTPPQTGVGGWGISACLVKKQSEMPKNFVCNLEIILKKIHLRGNC